MPPHKEIDKVNDLDRVLAEDDTLVPSAGFTSRVMDTVTAVATEPPPLAFPWGRFVGLVLACAAWAASGVWLATTPAASEIWSAFAGIEPLPPQVQDLGVPVAVSAVVTIIMVRWRPGRAPTP
jgi:hypothetical protein